MRKIIRKFFCVLTAVTVMLGGLQAPVAVQAQESGQQTGLSTLAGEDGVVVSTRDEFMNALKQRQSPITVSKLISIGEEAGADKRMLPVIIPGNTLIRATNGGAISSRGPIQLEGDGVCFQNIKLSFTSSSALGSVPHREIFLAGHSLTLDNVNTYLEGEPGLGALGGGEKELLPTVYAGGFSDTAVGQNASLTVKNSNDETMFQAIYMGNGKGTDNNVPYYGSAVLNLDAKVIVREGVDTVLNSQAEITISSQADKTVKVKDIYGNDNTTLTLSQGAMENAIVEDVGSIVLKDSACMSPVTQQFKNVTLVNGACLDLNGAGNAVLTGNFSGVEDPAAKRGILVLNPEGSLTIAGKVTGTTQFQTVNRLFPGWLLPGKTYIYAENGSGTEPNFILAQKSIDYGFELGYEADGWKVNGGQIDSSEIGHIEIVSAPSKVDLRKIPSQEDESIPDENVYFEVKWYDLKGEVFSDTDVLQEYGFYEGNYVVKIRTDYWKNDSDEVLDKTDWYQSIWLLASEEHPGRYYLEAFEGATPGDYTFLFCSEPFETLNTVADVKALKSTVMAEKRVIFYDQDQEEPDEPEHTHAYQGTVTTEPACTEAGVKTFVCECGEKYTEKIPALGHKAVTDPRVEPTETEPGKTEGSHCSVCEEILIAQETIPATGKPGEHQHNYQSEVTKEASCTEAGVKTFVCECGEKYTETIPALGHKAVTDPRVEPTETEPGKTEGSHCSVCKEILIAQETIPATGKPGEHQHNYQSEVTKEASCTEAGIRTYSCICGEQYTEQIAALSHQYVEKCIPATLRDSGVIQQICRNCSDVQQSVVIDSPRKGIISKTDFTYDGKVKTPSAVVKDSKGKSLTEGTDYRVIYSKGRKNPGIYAVTIEFQGKYSGEFTENFTIRPKKTSLKKVSAKSRGIQVVWKKQTTQTDGYEIQYCTSGNFKGKTLKKATVKKGATAKKISGLKGKKKYYVRIRTYKTVRVDGKSKKLYSDWSGKKTVRTKR